MCIYSEIKRKGRVTNRMQTEYKQKRNHKLNLTFHQILSNVVHDGFQWIWKL
jgi:hypothetical protein